jgi:hypothetical protein
MMTTQIFSRDYLTWLEKNISNVKENLKTTAKSNPKSSPTKRTTNGPIESSTNFEGKDSVIIKQLLQLQSLQKPPLRKWFSN